MKIANKDNSVHIGVGHSMKGSDVHGIVVVRCSGLFLVYHDLFSHEYFYVPKNLGVIPGEPKRLVVMLHSRTAKSRV